MQDFLIGKHDFEEDEKVLRYKMMMSAILMVVFIFVLSGMAVFRYLNAEMTQAIADLILVFTLIIGWALLRVNKHFFRYVSRFLLFVGLGLATLQFLWYPESHSRVIWFSTVVYLGFFLLDRREGWLWLGAIITGLIGLFTFDPQMMGLNFFEVVTLIVNLFIISLLLSWYEKFKEDNHSMYKAHREELETEIHNKTKELQRLNATLHQRVESEIGKNRDREKQMIHQSRLAQMGEMISMIAHQWRQPLASISATASALKLKVVKENFDKEFYISAIEQITKSSQHLSSTIDDFRNFFSPNKERESFTLQESLRRSIDIIGSSLANNNITVTMEAFDDSKVLSYPNEVRQVILNLIKNSEDVLIEKKVPNPKIHFKIDAIGQMAILEIHDNAGGIDDAIKDLIFDPYFTTKQKRDGTGLGLYMSKTIIEDHCGGKIQAYNGKEGAIFEIAIRKESDDEAPLF